MQTPLACQCLRQIMSLWKLKSKTRKHSDHKLVVLVFVNLFSQVTTKDTGDVVEEILILKTALLTDFIHCL